MAKAFHYQAFYCPRLKPGVKFEQEERALAFNFKSFIHSRIYNLTFSFNLNKNFNRQHFLT